MADIYVRSTDGSNADNGSTWALAKADLTGAAAIDAAGDRLLLSDNHSESTASALSFALAGTTASPTQILGVDDSAEPPTAMLAGATVATTGASGIAFTGATGLYVNGVTFSAGSGSASSISIVASSSAASARSAFVNCAFVMLSTGGSSSVGAIGGTGSFNSWANCTVQFSAAGQGVSVGTASGELRWNGGGLTAGTAPNNFVSAVSSGCRATLENLTLTGLGTSSNLCVGPANNSRVIFRNCRLPASWAGSLASTAPGVAGRVEMHNCDAGDPGSSTYRLWIEDYAGSIKTETTIVRSGGASDGTNPFSWKLTSSANARFVGHSLASPELFYAQTSVGSGITVTVEIVTDGVTLNDDECWLEVSAMNTSGQPVGTLTSSAKANPLASGASLTSSSVTWTTTGLASPVKQKLSVTFTPQEAGTIIATVRLAKASTTVYVDPYLTVT